MDDMDYIATPIKDESTPIDEDTITENEKDIASLEIEYNKEKEKAIDTEINNPLDNEMDNQDEKYINFDIPSNNQKILSPLSPSQSPLSPSQSPLSPSQSPLSPPSLSPIADINQNELLFQQLIYIMRKENLSQNRLGPMLGINQPSLSVYLRTQSCNNMVLSRIKQWLEQYKTTGVKPLASLNHIADEKIVIKSLRSRTKRRPLDYHDDIDDPIPIRRKRSHHTQSHSPTSSIQIMDREGTNITPNYPLSNTISSVSNSTLSSLSSLPGIDKLISLSQICDIPLCTDRRGHSYLSSISPFTLSLLSPSNYCQPILESLDSIPLEYNTPNVDEYISNDIDLSSTISLENVASVLQHHLMLPITTVHRIIQYLYHIPLQKMKREKFQAIYDKLLLGLDTFINLPSQNFSSPSSFQETIQLLYTLYNNGLKHIRYFASLHPLSSTFISKSDISLLDLQYSLKLLRLLWTNGVLWLSIHPQRETSFYQLFYQFSLNYQNLKNHLVRDIYTQTREILNLHYHRLSKEMRKDICRMIIKVDIGGQINLNAKWTNEIFSTRLIYWRESPSILSYSAILQSQKHVPDQQFAFRDSILRDILHNKYTWLPYIVQLDILLFERKYQNMISHFRLSCPSFYDDIALFQSIIHDISQSPPSISMSCPWSPSTYNLNDSLPPLDFMLTPSLLFSSLSDLVHIGLRYYFASILTIVIQYNSDKTSLTEPSTLTLKELISPSISFEQINHISHHLILLLSFFNRLCYLLPSIPSLKYEDIETNDIYNYLEQEIQIKHFNFSIYQFFYLLSPLVSFYRKSIEEKWINLLQYSLYCYDNTLISLKDINDNSGDLSPLELDSGNIENINSLLKVLKAFQCITAQQILNFN